MRLFLLPIKFLLTQSFVAFGVISSAYVVWLKLPNVLIGRFHPNNVQWLYTIFHFASIYENYYHEQLAKISSCVKYSIDAYHWYILLRYILAFCFRNLNSCDYHGDSHNAMFPLVSWLFPEVSAGVSTCFSWCFGFLQCFSCFPAVFLLFPILDFAYNIYFVVKK